MIETILQILVIVGILIMLGGGIKMYLDKKNNPPAGR